VLHAHTLKPFDTETLIAATSGARLVVTVEEHWPTGGLGSVVAEELCEHAPRPLLRIAMPDRFVDTVGGQERILADNGITAADIAAGVRTRLTGTALSGTDLPDSVTKNRRTP
jgi:transketolase